MELEQARARIEAYTKEQFGRLVELREVSVVRHASGRTWVGDLYCVTRRGDVMVGRIGVNEAGEIVGRFGVDQMIDALTKTGKIDDIEETAESIGGILGVDQDELFDFNLDDTEKPEASDDEADEIEGFFAGLDNSAVRARIDRLVASGSREDLLEARRLLPQLLTNPETRGSVLRQMGEVEIALGETDLGLNYLEAAAREFTDRADTGALEQVAELAHAQLDEKAFSAHPIKGLLNFARARQQPIDNLAEVSVFAGLGSEELFELVDAAEDLTVRAGQHLLEEGEPARRAFAVKSGILSIRLEAPAGGSRVVRCCFPRSFVGESCVIGPPGVTCSATVRAECLTALWAFDGERLREVVQNHPALKARIESTQTLNRLDSFFSMNESTETLDVRVRDQLLSCIVGIRSAQPGEVLFRAESLPDKVYLITEGLVEFQRPGAEARPCSSDAFIGLRDTLHGLALEGDYVVARPTRLICFDPQLLQDLAARAPAEVTAVLERL